MKFFDIEIPRYSDDDDDVETHRIFVDSVDDILFAQQVLRGQRRYRVDIYDDAHPDDEPELALFAVGRPVLMPLELANRRCGLVSVDVNGHVSLLSPHEMPVDPWDVDAIATALANRVRERVIEFMGQPPPPGTDLPDFLPW